MKVTKTLALSKVQAMACEHIFGQLQEASKMFGRAENMAKSRYAEVLAEHGVGPEYVEMASYDGNPTAGPTITYEVEEADPAIVAEAFVVPDMPVVRGYVVPE